MNRMWGKDVLPLRGPTAEGRAVGQAINRREVPPRGMDGGFGLRAEASRCPVLLVGDLPIVLAGLRALLSRERTVRVAGEVVGTAAAMQAAPAGLAGAGLAGAGAGVVVFAIAAWTGAWAEALAAVRARHPGARAVLVLGDGDPAQMRHFLAAGGHAALPMSAGLDSLLEALRAARPDAAVLEETQGGLSGRESLVLRRKVNGQTNKAIAAELGLSVKTVETYYTRAMEKLGLQNRSQVLQYALDQGWISAAT